MLNKKPIPWFAGSLILVALGLMSFATYGLAQNATDPAPPPATEQAPPVKKAAADDSAANKAAAENWLQGKALAEKH
ncbi:uncharacterized protein METZ01_LOCUS283090, partial [marine metagenome]